MISSNAVSRLSMCKKEIKVIYEAFADEKVFQAKSAGPIFCSTMNGKLANFPESYSDFMELLDYKKSFMLKKKISYMGAVVRAKSVSVSPNKPKIGYPPGGYFDIYELDTGRKLEPDDKVKKSISKDHHSYQSEEDLCYIMRSSDWYPPKGFDSERSWFMTQRCERYGGWWAVCMFTQKIFVKVSGLCTFSPVDKIFTLMDPDNSQMNSRFGTFSGREYIKLCMREASDF